MATAIPVDPIDQVNSIVDAAERVLDEIIINKEPRHPTYIYLQWNENAPFRRELLRKIIYDIPVYVKIGGDYAIKRHARVFTLTLTAAAKRHGLLIGPIELDQLREFLLSTMILIHSLFPDYSKLMMEMKQFLLVFQTVSEFVNMSYDEWATCLSFHNYLKISMQLISSTHNKVKMINAAAMLVGINNCLQGGGRTTQARRLYSIFDYAASHKEKFEVSLIASTASALLLLTVCCSPAGPVSLLHQRRCLQKAASLQAAAHPRQQRRISKSNLLHQARRCQGPSR